MIDIRAWLRLHKTIPSPLPSGQTTESVEARGDVQGRQVTYPYQIRDFVSTGRASLTRGQETAIIAGIAGIKLDAVQVVGINTSTNAVQVDIRSTTGNANPDFSLEIPAGQTVPFPLVAPWPQTEAGSAWTAQNPAADQSDSPIIISMQAIQNV